MLDIGKVKNRWWTLLSCFIIALLSVDVVLLTFQNKQLKSLLSVTTLQGQVESLKPGERVEPFKIQQLDGKTRELNYTDPSLKYLLFVLSTTCPHCENNLARWKTVAETPGGNGRCTIIGLFLNSLNETIKYATEKNPSFYIASVAPDTSFLRKYKISGVPITILVTGFGVVEKTWVGELSQEQTKEIQTLMFVSRPLTN